MSLQLNLPMPHSKMTAFTANQEAAEMCFSRLNRLDSVVLVIGRMLPCTGACRQICGIAAVASSLLGGVACCSCGS